MKKILYVMLAILMPLVFVFTGCDSAGNAEPNLTEEEVMSKLSLDDIDWQITTIETENGDESATVRVKNNSDYEILSFSVLYQKDDDSSWEELEGEFGAYLGFLYYNDLKSIEEEKPQDIIDKLEVHANAHSIKAGKSVDGDPINLSDSALLYGNFYISENALNLMKPTEISVLFVDDNYCYDVTFDGESGKAKDAEATKKIQWSSNELTKKLPKPNSDCIQEYIDLDGSGATYFVFNQSESDYTDYVEACIDKGFPENNYYSIYGSYSETSDNGYHLRVSFYGNRYEINIDKRN